MSRLRSSINALVFVVAIAVLPSLASAQDKVDLTGKWLLTVTTDAGTGTPSLTLKQSGDSLTGHYSSQLLGEADVRGAVKDKKVTISFRVDVQGTALNVSYAGTIESKDAFKGTVDLGGAGSGTFTAKRQ